MAKRPTVTTISSGYASNTQLNGNFEALRDAFDNTLSLDGSTPNSMGADLDMNSNDILNAGVVNATEVVVAGNSVAASVAASAANAAASAASAAAAASASALGYVAVDTITELKASATEVGTVHLFAVGRSGAFKWRSGDFSTEITTDTQNGVYVKSDDVASNLGAWVRVFDGPLQSGWFGVTPQVAGEPIVDLTLANQNMTDFAALYFNHVEYAAGYYFMNHWLVKRGVRYDGLGAVENLRYGASGNEFDNLLLTKGNVKFIFMGDSWITEQTPWCSDGYHLGFDRDILVADQHPTAATKFDRLSMFDGTNRDAVNATPATLRDLKVAVSVEDSYQRVYLHNIQFVPSCPDGAETYGLTGYVNYAEIKPWADYDVGMFITNSWGFHMHECQIAGYWRDAGFLNYLPADDGFTNYTSNSEHGNISSCGIQSGAKWRSGDLYPIVDTLSTRVYVRWSPSHQFDPAGGTLKITSGDTFGATTDMVYTSMFHTASPTPGPAAKTGRFLAFVVADTSSIAAGSHVYPVDGQGGISHTVVKDCTLTGVDHLTAVDESSDEMVTYRDKYSSALEVSGAPMRALRFDGCLLSTQSPVCIHVGMARDLTFVGNCYAESKLIRYTLGGAFASQRGTTFICGHSVRDDGDGIGMYAVDGGSACKAGVHFGQEIPLNSTVNMAPRIEPRSGSRMATMMDVFHPAQGTFGPYMNNAFSGQNDHYLDLLAEQQMFLRVMQSDFSQTTLLKALTASGTAVLDLGDDGSGGYQLRLRSNGQIDFSGPVDVNGSEALNVNGAHNFKVYTTAQLGDASHVSNTQGKQEGTSYFGSDTNKLYIALGGGATSTWSDMEGTANIVPA